jgi:uncharacterized protein (TIGR02246 family)
MKNFFLLLMLNLTGVSLLYSQHKTQNDDHRKAITALIDQYSEAREKNDTLLLKNILTSDVDQLVSTGEWRNGINAAVQGMLKSSVNTPGTRTLTIENIRMFNPSSAIVDCRYDIQNTDGSIRKMWSTFLVVIEKKKWKISAIRNMLPANP